MVSPSSLALTIHTSILLLTNYFTGLRQNTVIDPSPENPDGTGMA